MKHKSLIQLSILTLLSLILAQGCYYDNEEYLYPGTVCDTTNVTYSQRILPLLQRDCLACHTQAVASASVVLEGYSAVKQQVTNGKLLGVITHAQGFSPMPKTGSKWTDCEISSLQKWIAEGAPQN